MEGKINSFCYRNCCNYQIIMALSNLLNFIAWRYKGQCKRFLIMKWTYKNWKTLFSGNLKFKKMNSYSHKIRLQWAVWQAGQVWRQITELPQWISLITDWQVLPSVAQSTRIARGWAPRAGEDGHSPLGCREGYSQIHSAQSHFPSTFELKKRTA